MASQERLQRLTRKELVELARQRKIRGYSRMTKEELIAALTGEPTRERTPSRISQRRQTTTPTETKQTRGPRSRAARSAEKSAADASQASSSQTGEAMPARQRSAARLGESGVATPEEQVETSKYEVGVRRGNCRRNCRVTCPQDMAWIGWFCWCATHSGSMPIGN
jgi:hypothetical protein